MYSLAETYLKLFHCTVHSHAKSSIKYVKSWWYLLKGNMLYIFPYICYTSLEKFTFKRATNQRTVSWHAQCTRA